MQSRLTIRRAFSAWLLVLASTTTGACTASVPDTDAVVAHDYGHYWEVLQEVRAGSSIPVANLEEVAAGTLLRSLTADVNSMRSLGEVYVGSPKRNVESVEVTNTRAYVLDCIDISGWMLAPEATKVAIPGQLVQEEPALYEFTLALKDDAWFVTVSQQVDHCAL